MKLLTLTTSTLAILALPALAQSNIESTSQNMGQAAEEMAQETGDTVNKAFENTGETINNAVNATGDMVNDAAESTNEAIRNLEETAQSSEQEMVEQTHHEFIRASNIMGGEIYTTSGTNDTWAEQFMYPEVSEEWTRIGNIHDLALDKDGKLIGVVAEVGGFLDIGDKHIMIPLETLNMAADGENYALVTPRSLEELQSWPSVEESVWD